MKLLLTRKTMGQSLAVLLLLFVQVASQPVTGAFAQASVFAIGNRVWLDVNNNSTINSGETGINGVIVNLYLASDLTTIIDTQVTANGGYYLFNNLPAESYIVAVAASNFSGVGVLSNYWSSGTSRTAVGTITEATAATANSDIDSDDNGTLQNAGSLNGSGISSVITLGPAITTEPAGEADLDGGNQGQPDTQANMTVDFGFYTTAVGDTVWYDVDNSGVQDGGEVGIDTVTVELRSGDGSALLAATTTSGGGDYSFIGLPAGDYIIRLPASNFNPAGILRDYRSSTGEIPAVAYEPAPDADVNLTDADDNGSETNGLLGLGGYIQTLPVTLGGTTKLQVDFGVNNSPQIDLVVTKTDNQSTYVAGGTLNYVIVVTNNGPADANGMTIHDALPAQITSWIWDCAVGTPAGYNCTSAASNSANFTDTLDLPQLASVTYNVTAQVSPTATGNLTNTVFTRTPPGMTDMTPLDNIASDVDTKGITVSSVIASSGNQLIVNGGSYKAGFAQLKIIFSADANNPAGNNGTDDVTNPANYLLIQSGPNGAFNTVACSSGLAGDDVQIPTGPVTYSNGGGSGPFVALVTLNNGNSLSSGTYRLFICGTTSITDLAGDPLNGGADTLLAFTIFNSSATLPVTGFSPNMLTVLPDQPASLAYADLSAVWIEIPSLGIKEDIVGVPALNNGWSLTWLSKQVGWLEGTAFPSWNGNSVLTAHVTNADGRPGVFANLNELTEDQQVIVHAFGFRYEYAVRASQTVSASNTAWVFQHQDQPWLTLMTCENYNERFEKYRNRRAVRAVLMKVVPEP